VAISVYKKYVSPFKGFRCAYRVLHGGNSCSTEIYELINKHGVLKGIPLAKVQLKRCTAAYKILSSKKEDESDESGENRNPEKKDDKFSWCDLPCLGVECASIAKCGGGKGGLDCDLPF